MLHIKKGKEQNHKQNTGVNVTQEKKPSPSSHPLCYYGTRRNLWIINTKVPLTKQLSSSSASVGHPPP